MKRNRCKSRSQSPTTSSTVAQLSRRTDHPHNLFLISSPFVSRCRDEKSPIKTDITAPLHLSWSLSYIYIPFDSRPILSHLISIVHLFSAIQYYINYIRFYFIYLSIQRDTQCVQRKRPISLIVQKDTLAGGKNDAGQPSSISLCGHQFLPMRDIADKSRAIKKGKEIV